VNVGTAGCFQHPPWYLQGPRTLCRFQTTANNRLPTPEADFVDPDRAAVPRMPRVMNFPRISAMGIVLMSCTITGEHICRWAKTPQKHDEYSPVPTGQSLRGPKSAVCIIVTNVEPPDRLPREPSRVPTDYDWIAMAAEPNFRVTRQ
jgi:hypothetical protein